MFELKIPLSEVMIIRSGGADQIFLYTTKEHSELIQKEFSVFMSATRFRLDVTQGRGEEVCRDLGIPDSLVKLIDLNGKKRDCCPTLLQEAHKLSCSVGGAYNIKIPVTIRATAEEKNGNS